ncbi:MAG TPA: methyl-accepting chemotaxis protein [Burkholderiaceae bacterium]|nr:methyl-accepting chemotaxis protein [Burkholderiaceae bacterium]
MSFLRDLGFGAKFAVLWVLAALAVLAPSTLYWREASDKVSFAERELAGVNPIKGIYDAIRLSQEHRGLTSSALAGNGKARDARVAKQAEALQAIQATGHLLQVASATGPLVARWRAVGDEWQRLAQDVAAARLDGPESFRRHTVLIEAEIAVLADALDSFGWMLESDPGLYYSMIATSVDGLALTERIGQLRALGARLLARKSMYEDEKLLLHARLIGAQEMQRLAAGGLERAFQDARVRQVLEAKAASVKQQLEAVSLMVDNEMVRGGSLERDPSEFFSMLTGLIQSQFELARLATGHIETALAERVAQVRRERLMLALVIVVLGGVCAGMAAAFARHTVKSLNEARHAADAIAGGKLGEPIVVRGRDEVGQLMASLVQMQAGLGQIVSRVRAGAELVSTATQQISAGTVDLSARTEEQASALQQTAASMEQLTGSVAQNASSAHEAESFAREAAGIAGEGRAEVERVVATIGELSRESRSMSEIIGVIDGIAFQTNILALNASVEAARAGQQGRGFAVVASEVRTLAQRCADAAREIRELIVRSGERVADGVEQANQAGATMQRVLDSVRRVSQRIGQISDATREQHSGIGQIGEAVSAMDRSTQQNSALVEESAAATQSLKQQAQQLVEAVGVFRL